MRLSLCPLASSLIAGVQVPLASSQGELPFTDWETSCQPCHRFSLPYGTPNGRSYGTPNGRLMALVRESGYSYRVVLGYFRVVLGYLRVGLTFSEFADSLRSSLPRGDTAVIRVVA